MGAESVAGGATSASLCPSKLALLIQYEYNKIKPELLTINFEFQKCPFNF